MSEAGEIDPPKATPTDAASDAASQVPEPGAWRRAIGWGFETFGPLIAFALFEHTLGLVAAIVAGTITSVVLVTLQIIREKKISPFTAFVAASVVGFGALDFHFRTGFFVKIEPALGNALTGIFFLGTVLIGRPIIIELAEKRMGRKLDRAHGYLRGWTIAWAFYFFLRAGVYVWMAYRLTIDQALVIRGTVAPLSFGVMFLIEMLSRKIIFPKSASSESPGSGSVAQR